MRNPPSHPSSPVRPLAAALLLGAALLVTEASAPAAHAIPRPASTTRGATASGSARPGVAPRIVRAQRRIRPGRRLRAERRFPFRASRSATRIRSRAAAAPRPLIPLTDPAWARLRHCESGGRYDINTGNGFYGAYQFVASTWRGLGYAGMPHHAPPHVQDEAAQRLQARSGWGQWPACTRRLGLR
jgi:hypothetical protein